MFVRLRVPLLRPVRHTLGVKFVVRCNGTEQFVSRKKVESYLEQQNRKEDEKLEEEGFDPEYKKRAMFGVNKDSPENKDVDLNEIFKKVEKLEKVAKFYVTSRGIPLVEPFDRPDSFFHKGQGTRVISPEIRKRYVEQHEMNKKIVAQRHKDFEHRAKSAAKKAVHLREKHWGYDHHLTLSSHLIYLSVLEVAEESKELQNRCIFWLMYCEKHLPNAFKRIQQQKIIEGVPESTVKEILEGEYQLLLSFYASVCRLLGDLFVRQGQAEDSIDLLKVAMMELGRNEKDNFVYLVLLGRSLSNAYLELGELENAITTIELVLDLQSNSQIPQNAVQALTVDDWVDPIRERINTTVILARLKMTVLQYTEAEGLLRTALMLATEHAGKYTPLACSIQYELLNLVKQCPDHSDQDFLDLFHISLDIARETHSRIDKDIANTETLMGKLALAETMPYSKLLRLGVDLYQFHPHHKDFYLKMLLETVKVWPDEIIQYYSPDYCEFGFFAVEELLANGRVKDAGIALAHMQDITGHTFLDPSVLMANYTTLQAEVQNLIDFKERAKALPFFEPSDVAIPKNNSLSLVLDLINDSLSSVKRASNNEYDPKFTVYHLYVLATTRALYGSIGEAEDNILRCLTLAMPNFEEKELKLEGEPEKVDEFALTALGNLTVFAGSLFENTQQLKRATKYYQFACRVLSIPRKTGKTMHTRELNFPKYYMNKDAIERYQLIQKCLVRLIDVHRELMKFDPIRYSFALLESYRNHLHRVESELSSSKNLHQQCIDAFFGGSFKDGPDVSHIMDEAVDKGLLNSPEYEYEHEQKE